MSTKIKYKDTTITLESGQTATLHIKDEKLTEDMEITAFSDGESVPEWDGSIEVI